MKYIEANCNPTGKKRGDCVVRAISQATGKPWLEIYDGLATVGRQVFEMPNGKLAYETYLKEIGWLKQRMPRFPDNTRYTVEEFADEHNQGVFIVSVANHMTTIINGQLYDTWDCSEKSVGNFWVKQTS